MDIAAILYIIVFIAGFLYLANEKLNKPADASVNPVRSFNPDDYESDDEGIEVPSDTDDIDDTSLELLGWLVPLGYRALATSTGVEAQKLRRHIRATLLSPLKSSYKDIEKYFSNSQCHSFKMRLKKVIKVTRYDDYNFDYDKSNEKLLWHGTQKNKLGSILVNGFCRPEHMPRRQMFGNGIYFADRASKSAQYCNGLTSGSVGYLCLCAVNLGRIFMSVSAQNHYKEPPPNYDSVMGVGYLVPNEKEAGNYRNYKVPFGKTVSNTGECQTTSLKYNEYIVYDTNRISIKFIAEFEIV